MTFEAFELAVIDLASRRVRLTVANVAAHVRVPPSQVEELLDRMAREGRVDVELDEDQGVIFYVVRGLTPPPTDIALRPIDYRQAAAPPMAKRPSQRSPLVGALLGFFLPGVGLLYAAPWSAALAVTIGIPIAAKMVAVLPLIGWLLSSVVVGLAAVASGVLGAMYARKYNQHGRRTHLDLDATKSAGQTLVNPLREAQRVALM